MNTAILGLLDVSQPLMLSLFAVFLRIGAAMSLMPGFGEQSVPMRIKLMLGFSFTLVVWPMLDDAARLSTIPAHFFFTEAVVGLAIGLFFRLFVMVLQLAGMMAAQATSLSQIFGGGATADPMPAFSNLLVIAGLALAMMSGLHIKLAIALAETYKVLPLGAFPDPASLSLWGTHGVSRAFALSFSLAAPFVIASVIYNVSIGAMNRAMPQLMVAFIGAPAITFAGLVMLAVAAPIMLGLWLGRFDAGLSDPFGQIW